MMTLIMTTQLKSFVTDNDEVSKDSQQVGHDINMAPVKELIARMVHSIKNAYFMDQTGLYMVVSNIISATAISNDSCDLTLCSQTSHDHLDNLVDLTLVWSGPISVAVFCDDSGDVLRAIHRIAYLHLCYERIAQAVSFHIAFPLSTGVKRLSDNSDLNFSCENTYADTQLSSNKNYMRKVAFPHNVLRNIAISFSTTPYILVIDIDLLPSYNLHSSFKQFVKRRLKSFASENVAYVLPAFESKLPDTNYTRATLTRAWQRGHVRQFYVSVCTNCHTQTDYEAWRGLPSVPFLDIAYHMDWNVNWEPFYIAAKNNLPMYDGRFKQYGFNRISQVNISCVGCFCEHVYQTLLPH